MNRTDPDDSISVRAYVNNFLMNGLSLCRIADIYVQKVIERVSTKKYMDNVIRFLDRTIPPNWNLLEPEIEPYIIWRRKIR